MLRFLPTAGLLATFLVAWAGVWQDLAQRWAEPQASHGWLVVLMAGWLAWSARSRIITTQSMPVPASDSFSSSLAAASSAWLGLVLILVAIAGRLAGRRYGVDALAHFSIPPAAAGLTLLTFGRTGFRAAGPAIALLALAMPLPWRVEVEASSALQRVSTTFAVFLLQLFGLPIYARGNIVETGATPVGVAEACSGLRMLTVQVVLAVALAFFLDRPLWQKIALVASAPLIAVACNAVRLAATVLAHRVSRSDSIGGLHDLFGWLMMPLGLAALAAELRLFSWLRSDPPPTPRAVTT